MLAEDKNSLFILKKSFLLCFLLVVLFKGYSQHQNIPINYFISQKIERSLSESAKTLHTAIKPYSQSFVDSAIYATAFGDSNEYYYDFTLKLFKESLLHIEEKDVLLVVDPLMNFGLGRTIYDDTLANYTTNTRGVRVAGNITSKFSFETRYYENQFHYPKYLDSIADSRGIAFGMGRAKPFKGTGLDVGMSSGYISYSPVEMLNIQFGQGKHFIGDGYRSMLLSDNAFNYPYLSFSLQLLQGKIFYKSINAWMQTLERMPVASTPEALFKRKNGSFRYLSFKPKKQIEIGLFEGVVYKRYKDSVGEVPVHSSFYAPIIGVASAMNAGRDENKVVLGVNLNVTPVKKVKLYGQFVVDDFSKSGFQVGGKWLDPFTLKNSWIMAEYNSAVPYLYSQSQENIIQNYSHSNQEIAHPLGASFNEMIVMTHFEMKRAFATVKYFYASKKRQGGGVYGENIFLPNDALLVNVPDERVNWSYYGGELGYNLNVQTKMQLFGSVYSRFEKGDNWENKEWFWQLGLRTTLNNFYYEQ